MWFLARLYSAQQALDMGLVNTVVPLAELESETIKWYITFAHHDLSASLPECMLDPTSRWILRCTPVACLAWVLQHHLLTSKWLRQCCLS